MKTRLILISFIIGVFSFTSYSQDTLNHVYKMQDIIKSNYIKFSPLHLLEIEPTLQLGYEYPLKNMRIQHEIGYVGLFNPSYALFQWNSNFNNITSNGFKIRTSIKFPLKSIDIEKPVKYIGIDIMYKNLSWTESDVEIWRLNSFWQLMDFTTTKQVAAIHFIYGRYGFVSNLNNIITDSYFGVGIRYKKLTNDMPEDVNNNNYPWWDEYSGMMISVMAGIKFGFGV